MSQLSVWVAFKIIAGVGLIAVAGIFLFLRNIEPHMLFYPVRVLEVFPDQAELEFKKVYFETDDKLTLNGWLVPARGSKYTLLFTHGNAGNISHRLEKIKILHQLGYGVFIFDYRGFGESQGVPSEGGLYKDAEAAYSYLLSTGIVADQIVGYGESLGGAVIVNLASTKNMKGLILDSTFSSLKDMAWELSPLLPSWMLASRFNSQVKLQTVACAKLIIHSVDDEVVPYKLGRRLYDHAKEPKIFLAVHGGHNSNFQESLNAWTAGISAFMASLAQ